VFEKKKYSLSGSFMYKSLVSGVPKYFISLWVQIHLTDRTVRWNLEAFDTWNAPPPTRGAMAVNQATKKNQSSIT
jgi:hypothetical protein